MIVLRPQKSFTSEVQQHFMFCQKEFTLWSDRDKGRILNLRCSALPFCPLDLFIDIATIGTAQSLDFSGMYFTRVGTTVHTVMQTMMVRQGDRVFGDWKCPKCKKVEHMSLFRKCDKCRIPMEYEELEIDYKGIKGHVDTLMVPKSDVALAKKISAMPEAKRYEESKKLRFIIVDYKTCSISNSAKKKVNPGSAYKSQIRAYAWLLTKQYGLQIVSTILMFLPRDNPNKPVYWEQAWNGADDMKKMGKLLKRWKVSHKETLAAETWEEVRALYENYGTCEGDYCKVCKGSSIKQVLKQAYKEAKAEDRLPIRTYVENA